MKILSYALPLILFSCQTITGDKTIENTDHQHSKWPIPTLVFENMADEEAYEERRDAYFDLIHSSSESFDWKAINALNFNEAAEKRAFLKQFRTVESFAEGTLEGEWQERGSKDVPGNIRVCDYHQSTDDIYVISDGGTLWKGNLDGESWIPLNEDIQFGRDIIKVVNLDGGGLRIITAVGKNIRYSDDNGETWTNSTGISGGNGSAIKIVELNDADRTLVYLYMWQSIVDGSTVNKVTYSTDHGASFIPIMDLGSGNRFASIHAANNSSSVYIFDNNDDLYRFNSDGLTTISTGLALDGTDRCMIQVNEAGGVLTLYVLMDNTRLYKSTDNGLTFNLVNELPTSPWDIGFRVSISDPSTLYYGEVNTYRSDDGGESWEFVSEWWEYYDDVANKLHADIMSIEPFKTASGTEFTLNANHGGIYVSYDHLITTSNLAMSDLNTGQFYDVLTHPTNSALIFGGTQDQGFQRTTTGDSPTPSSFQQVISGDYGEMQFTNSGQNIWIQYPGAWFQLYPNAATDDGYSYEFNLDGDDMPNVNWIVPTGAAPNPEDNFIYVGGGNLSGGSGSHLVKLTFTGSEIISSQSDFDFKAASGASISAIETTPFDPNLIFVVTENGRFFSSYDGGATFNMTESYVGPSGGWIYTADIYASRETPGLVFVGGSGYGGASVYMSTDSAKTFVPLTGDIPNTMTHELCMDPAEKFLFAATDAGPYVYSMELEEWYDLAGVSAPLQQYISVEFIPSKYTVRFATWGRGIWDFNLTSMAGLKVETPQKTKLVVYPNPANEMVQVKFPKNGRLSIYDLNGKLIQTETINAGITSIQTANFANGTYIFECISVSGLKQIEKIIIRH